MSMLLLACMSLSQLEGTPGDEGRNALWPLGSGFTPYELHATYGQLESDQNITLHEGLDVSDRQVATNIRTRGVYALEDGTVERVWIDDATNYTSGLVIASKAKPSRAWLYVHLEKDSIRFAVGDEVQIDELLGEVLFSDTVTDVPHLHLSRICSEIGTKDWEDLTSLSERNPLALLRPELLGDSAAPEIETIEGQSLIYRADESSSVSNSFRGTPIPASTAEVPISLDVLACASDGDLGPHRLAPYKLTLTVQDTPPQTFVLCLDGPLPVAALLSESVKRDALPPQFDPYFVLTNGADPACTGFEATGAWKPGTGKHTLELLVEDVAGNETSISVEVDAQAL